MEWSGLEDRLVEIYISRTEKENRHQEMRIVQETSKTTSRKTNSCDRGSRKKRERKGKRTYFKT